MNYWRTQSLNIMVIKTCTLKLIEKEPQIKTSHLSEFLSVQNKHFTACLLSM